MRRKNSMSYVQAIQVSPQERNWSRQDDATIDSTKINVLSSFNHGLKSFSMWIKIGHEMFSSLHISEFWNCFIPIILCYLIPKHYLSPVLYRNGRYLNFTVNMKNLGQPSGALVNLQGFSCNQGLLLNYNTDRWQHTSTSFSTVIFFL